MECSHCGGAVHLDEEHPPESYPDGGPGRDADLVWCSEACRQVVVDDKWPSPVGPASHDEIEEWIAEQEREDGRHAQARAAAQRRHDAWVSSQFDQAVARVMARKGEES